MTTCGLDIGGAYIKAAYADSKEDGISRLETVIEYFPMWKRKAELSDVLKEYVRGDVKEVAVTTTVDASDAFASKEDAINSVLDSVEDVFRNLPIKVLTTKPSLISVKHARENVRLICSANWIVMPWFLSRLGYEGIFMDMGSTTTDIIPIGEGKVLATGKTDLGRLSNSQLVYTGALRTNVAAIVEKLPYKDKTTRVSAEYFANTADVYMILEMITRHDYSCETADERGKDKDGCLRRLARLVCADTSELSTDDLSGFAEHIRKTQINLISDAVRDVISDNNLEKPKLFIAGVGSFLLKDVAKNLGLAFEDIAKILGYDTSIAAPAMALALMIARER